MRKLETQVRCPICHGKEKLETFEASSSPYVGTPLISLPVAVCRPCGSFYLASFIKEFEIHEFYPEVYYTKAASAGSDGLKFVARLASYSVYRGYSADGKNSPTEKLMGILYGIVYWHRLKRFPHYSKRGASGLVALEIGYGSGSYLKDLKKMGWNCFGVDSDQSNRFNLENEGITVAATPYELALADRSVDYIYSYHAFEHIYDLDSMLTFCKRVLRESGEFKVCVPVSDGLLPRLFKRHWYDLGVPIHKQIFSVRGFRALAERNGFHVKNVYFNSYSESFAGSLISLFLSTANSKYRAQSLMNKTIFKWLTNLFSPVVYLLDRLNLGDRVEIELAVRVPVDSQ